MNLGQQKDMVHPKNWSEFIGQERAVRQLKLSAQSAKVRKAAADHVLIGGESGIGKSALAYLFGQELGTTVHEVGGRIKGPEARKVIRRMLPHDVLFIDEAHQLADGGKANAEWLLHVLEAGVFMTALGPAPIPPITVVAATTDQGKLPTAIINRFLPVFLERPSLQEAAMICALKAEAVLSPHRVPLPSPENCVQIAGAANQIPRTIVHMMWQLRDLVLTKQLKKEKGGSYDLGALFELQGVTADGLDVRAQRVLTVMYDVFDGGPVSERNLQAQLAEPGGLTAVETVLIDKGYLRRTPQGRALTEAGMDRAEELTG